MAINATGSSVYLQYSSLFQKNTKTGESNFQANIGGVIANRSTKIAGTKSSVADILDLSPEGIMQSLARTASKNAETGTESDANAAKMPTSDEISISGSNILNTIRENKNAVLERVNELLAEYGIEVDPEQGFDIRLDLTTGAVDVSEIEDTELMREFNAAITGDERLAMLISRTREGLGLPEVPNTVSRYFAIGYNSMLPTPEDAELEYQIDVTVNRTEKTDETEDSQENIFAFEMSIRLAAQRSDLGDYVNLESDNEFYEISVDDSKPREIGKSERKNVEKNDRKEELAVYSRLEQDEELEKIRHEWSIKITISNYENGAEEENSRSVLSVSISGTAFYDYNQESVNSLEALPWYLGSENNEQWFESLNGQFGTGLIDWFRNPSSGESNWASEFMNEINIGTWLN